MNRHRHHRRRRHHRRHRHHHGIHGPVVVRD